ncbi:site-2 protease family protein [Asticcacaulis sp. AND118]|uniref:site-2 protease family protein n=1 Tax=Asticcacaulis sp. AND118 TaxID=2840468 RepID=UPI001CFFE4F5|nr:site-2 protease family protein [Asticcacaulis sp. AND118]UDF04374.1 site-2 protease family protein [Asticcacaulis sp. AND118]
MELENRTATPLNFIVLLAVFGAAGLVLWMRPEVAGIATFGFALVGWIVGLCLHEFGHAASAAAFGDYSVRQRGYLTLDPVVYINGPNSIVLPVLILVLGGIALPGAAVMMRPDLIRHRWQSSLISLAGPIMSLVFALMTYTAGQMAISNGAPEVFAQALTLLAFFNLMAFVLNLLPVPGFDGFGVITPLLPQPLRGMAEQLERMPWISLLALVVIFFFGFPYIFALLRIVAGVLGLDLSGAQPALERFRFWG